VEPSNSGKIMTIEQDDYERRRARLEAALRDAVSRGDYYLEQDTKEAMIELEKEYRELNVNEQEDLATKMLYIVKNVLKELCEKANVHEIPTKYYLLMDGHYVHHDYRGLSVWRSGCRGDPDSYRCEWKYELTDDLEKFKADIRAEALPLFNALRKSKQSQLEQTIKSNISELAKLEGEIE
jgi:hypothetical protein